MDAIPNGSDYVMTLAPSTHPVYAEQSYALAQVLAVYLPVLHPKVSLVAALVAVQQLAVIFILCSTGVLPVLV